MEHAKTTVSLAAGASRADSDQIGAVIARSALRDEAISTDRALTVPRLLRCRSQWRSGEWCTWS